METESMNQKPRRFRRKLTPFLCQELLFEYATNRLDADRRADVEEFLAQDKASKEVLKSVEAGIEYSNGLAKVTVPEALVRRLSYSENLQTAFNRTLDWRTWPESFRWSISAVVVSVLVAIIITLIPWEKLPSLRSKPSAKDGTVVLADIPVGETVEAGELPADETEGSGDEETSGDEHEAPGAQANIDEESFHADLAPAPEPMAKPASPKQTPAVAKPKPQAAIAPSINSEENDGGDSDSSTEAPVRSASETESENEMPAVASKSEKKPQGFVYRAFMNLPNVEEASPEIAQKLIDLGADKAGEVPLGWKRGKGSYFHFSLPESNEEAALEMLRSYGPVRISKDPHPRVMPEGQIRFILWVEPGT